MKVKRIILSLLLLFCISKAAHSAGDGFNRLHVSFTLGGHLLFGVGFEHGFSNHHALQATVYPLLIPGKGMPFAFHAGYNYYFSGEKWRAKMGVGYAFLVSPPDPNQRKVMPMLLFTPGISYHFKDSADNLLFQPWLAYFLKHANRRFAPIGLEFRYGHVLR